MKHELLTKYPNASEVVKEFYLKVFLNSLEKDGVPEEFKEMAAKMGITDDMITNIIEESPRSLFDVFDDNHIYINVTTDIYENGIEDEVLFKYSIDNVAVSNSEFDTRKEADKEAVEHAFELLEERLCSNLEDLSL